MKREHTGDYEITAVAGEQVKAFIPSPLPPVPGIDISPELQQSHDQALIAVGELNSLTSLLPDYSLLLYSYVRKEAVLSSRIEGTQSSLSDLLVSEMDGIPGVPLEDVTEVSNYVAAMQYGLDKIREGLPLSLRLIREMHEVLLRKGRGEGKNPGEFRTSQNWIGGTRPAMPFLCRLLLTGLWNAWVSWNCLFMIPRSYCPFSSRRRWCMCSSRPFTHSLTEMAAWDVC